MSQWAWPQVEEWGCTKSLMAIGIPVKRQGQGKLSEEINLTVVIFRIFQYMGINCSDTLNLYHTMQAFQDHFSTHIVKEKLTFLD